MKYIKKKFYNQIGFQPSQKKIIWSTISVAEMRHSYLNLLINYKHLKSFITLWGVGNLKPPKDSYMIYIKIKKNVI